LPFDGLNLTWETLEGIAKHNGPLKNINKNSTIFFFNENFMDLNLKTFPSLEAQVASISDDIAYMNHDLDDGFRAKLFNTKDLNKLNFYREIIKEYRLEPNNDRFKKELVRNLINKMVVDLIIQTEKNLQKIKPKNVNDIRNSGFNIASFSTKMKRNISEIRLFLNKRMYNHKLISDKTKKYKKIIENLYQQYFTGKADIPSKWIKETYIGALNTTDFEVNKKQMIIDYISGMTDRYILKIYNKI
jgi:dGTPase